MGAYAVATIALIVAVTVIARRTKIAPPILLVILGVGFSYLPGVPLIEIPYEIVLGVLLPPILYASAIHVSVVEFRKNFVPISALSVALVIVTAFISGFVLYTIIPPLNFAGALALGAIISPTDAVAVTSIGRKLGISPRLLSVIEGEGLVNDATALVLLRTALAAVAGTLATPWEGVFNFFSSAAIALIVGFLLGYIAIRLRSRFNDPILATALSFVIPFAAFLPTEMLGGSGVLAVVTVGLYTGHRSPKFLNAQARMTDRINWGTIQFLLENGVFLLIGIQLRFLITDVATHQTFTVQEAIGLGILLLLVLNLVRFAAVSPLIWFFQRRHRKQHPHRFQGQHPKKRLDEYRSDPLDWRAGMLISWAGMRGVVTLAAAQSLPASLPYRNQLVVVAFTIAFGTIVLQGTTLPILIRLLRLKDPNPQNHQRLLAQLLDELSSISEAVLNNAQTLLSTPTPPDPALLERVKTSSMLKTEAAWEHFLLQDEPLENRPNQTYFTLRLAIVAAERKRLLEESRNTIYPAKVLNQVHSMLDIEETSLLSRSRSIN